MLFPFSFVPIYRFPDRSRTKSRFLWHGHDFEGSVLTRGYCYVPYHMSTPSPSPSV